MAASFTAPIGGSAGADSLVGDRFGNPANDTILGLGSADSIEGLGGNDVLFGGFGNDRIDGGAGRDYVEGGAGADTLSGGGGRDVLSYAQSAAAVEVNLGTGLANGGDATGDLIGGFEDLVGSQGNDSLAGDAKANGIAGGFGNDALTGNGGNDTLQGGAGEDTLLGGAGADVFLFVAETDSTVGNPDIILDFAKGVDLIDLSGIDANANTVGDDAFVFVAGGFTGVAGQLVDTGLDLQGDTDGDGVADFAIQVFSPGGGVVLAPADIVL